MRRFVATVSTVLIAVALFGACGGSSDKPAASPETQPGSSQSNGSSDSGFSKLYADALKQKFKITFVSENGDTTTYAQDGKGKSVYGSGDSLYFTSPDGSVSCSTPAGGKAECTKLPGGVGGAVSPFLGIYNAGRTYVEALAQYGDTSSKSIAGRDAKCVTFSKDTITKAGPVGAAIAAAIKGSVTYCVDKSTGVLLLFSTTDENGKTTNSLSVTKFEEPSDSDFTPPATASSASTPSLPPGYTVPSVPGYTIPGGG